MTKRKTIIDRLNEANPWIQFLPACEEVIAGFDLVATGNQWSGKNVYVATHAPPDVADVDLRIGRFMTPGKVEGIGAFELRCKRAGSGNLVVSLHDANGNLVGIPLTARVGAGELVDEGCFTWFGPVEDICTPWSDNDPSQCQVVTVEQLREFARARK